MRRRRLAGAALPPPFDRLLVVDVQRAHFTVMNRPLERVHPAVRAIVFSMTERRIAVN